MHLGAKVNRIWILCSSQKKAWGEKQKKKVLMGSYNFRGGLVSPCEENARKEARGVGHAT